VGVSHMTHQHLSTRLAIWARFDMVGVITNERHTVLHFDGATHSVYHAAKLDKDAVTGALHHAAVMHSDGRIDYSFPRRGSMR